MADMVLLGAGASKEAGVPTAYEMTEKVVEYYDRKAGEDVMYRYCAQLLRNVIGSLLHEKVTRGENALAARVDIEELVSTLQMLSCRRFSRLRPFVVDWRRLIRLDELRGISGPAHAYPKLYQTLELLRHLRDAARAECWPPDDAGSSLAREFSDQVRELSDPMTWERSLLGWALMYIWEYLDTVLWVGEGEAGYLKPLVDLAQRQPDLVIASLNYDNSFEELCRSMRVLCQTHETTWHREGEFPLDQPGVTLLKLHGSVKWQFRSAHWVAAEVRRESVRPRTRPHEPCESWAHPPTVILGPDNKLRPTGPFLDLLFAYKQALMRADRLIIIGYSFRDEHINAAIRFWINSGVSRDLIVIDPAFPQHEQVRHDGSLVSDLLELEIGGVHKVRFLRKGAGDALALLGANDFELE